MNNSTFDILSEFRAIEELTNDVEINEETGEIVDNTAILKELMDKLQSDKDTKLDNVEYIKRDFKLKENGLSDEIKRLTERRNSMRKKQEFLSSLQDYLLDGEKCKTDKFTFFYGSSTSTEIEDEDELPEEYINIEYKVNKAEITKVLRGGGAVAGAKLIEKTSLRVR